MADLAVQRLILRRLLSPSTPLLRLVADAGKGAPPMAGLGPDIARREIAGLVREGFEGWIH